MNINTSQYASMVSIHDTPAKGWYIGRIPFTHYHIDVYIKSGDMCERTEDYTLNIDFLDDNYTPSLSSGDYPSLLLALTPLSPGNYFKFEKPIMLVVPEQHHFTPKEYERIEPHLKESTTYEGVACLPLLCKA
jgi:hypothetical protein